MQSDQTADKPRRTFTDFMRVTFKGVIDPIAAYLNRIGLAPNTVTLIGLAGNFIAAIFLARGQFLVGGLLVWFMGPIDALDGTMARMRGEASEFGAFVDSVSDRYSEVIIYGGLLIYYMTTGDTGMMGLIFLATIGSLMVSYVRGRGEGLGFSVKGGLLTRMERYIVMVPALVLGFTKIGLIIIAVLANFTALQRIFLVRRQARKRENS
jgi:CDP-diacylglycerol---glycerol-3-phosphate 3-phosphatidyltransferase